MGRSRERRRWLREREDALRAARAARVGRACELCVVGGGASGLVAALEAARAGMDVVVLEARESLGLPILATGNGRCNLANVDLSPAHYNDPAFVGTVMGERPLEEILAFFGELGLAVFEEEGRLYPRSLQAASVRNLLVAALEVTDARCGCARPVTAVESAGGAWIVRYRNESEQGRSGVPTSAPELELRAKRVLWSAGGGSLAPLEALGLPLVACRPGLCPLAVAPSALDELAGRKVRGVLTLEREGRIVAEEEGEILLREARVSGIPAFDLSRKALPGDRLTLDLVPERTQAEVEAEIHRLSKSAGRLAPHCLDGLVDPAIARVILELAERGWPLPADGVAESAAALAKRLPFEVTGAADDHPQLTLGGLALRAVDAGTLAVLCTASGAELPAGLFASGEALDVDGPCGGYNLAFAWLSGARAAHAIARGLRP